MTELFPGLTDFLIFAGACSVAPLSCLVARIARALR